LDVGCMEWFASILAARRGAHVTAWDRLHDDMNSSDEKLDWLRSKIGGPEVFVRSKRIGDIRPGTDNYDVVVLAGVLYHAMDPFATLLTARSLLRNGGLMLVETAVAPGDDSALCFNNHGRFYWDPAQANYWLPTLPCLDAMLRCARLSPLDGVWIDDPVARFGVVCRAVPHVPDDHPWMQAQMDGGAVAANYGEFIDWRGVESTAPFTKYGGPLGFDDLPRMKAAVPPLRVTTGDDSTTLFLKDVV
ncbi:MAG: DUF1698 domain-containing protein, partial [Thermoguttaceae bacterium]